MDHESTRRRLEPSRCARRLLIAMNRAQPGSLQATYLLANNSELWLPFVDQRLSRSDARELARSVGVPRASLRRAMALTSRAKEIANRELNRCRDLGARIVSRVDPEYPVKLLDLELPPPVLYVIGSLHSMPAVSVVGSRRSDPYGLEVAELFSAALASSGLAIVSGLALGIDAAAHQGALRVGGHTLAVLGCGIDVDYPLRNRRLREEIYTSGVVISEFALGARPEAWRFPIRNRIIAALSVGTLVVRATPRSGSLITARHALELGRDVYAVPGDVFDQRSVGPNSLIRDGAHPVQHPREIAELAGITSPAPPPLEQPPAPVAPPSEPRLAAVLDHLPIGHTLSEEDVVAACSLSIEATLAALLELEIGGWIERHPGPRFLRTNRQPNP